MEGKQDINRKQFTEKQLERPKKLLHSFCFFFVLYNPLLVRLSQIICCFHPRSVCKESLMALSASNRISSGIVAVSVRVFVYIHMRAIEHAILLLSTPHPSHSAPTPTLHAPTLHAPLALAVVEPTNSSTVTPSMRLFRITSLQSSLTPSFHPASCRRSRSTALRRSFPPESTNCWRMAICCSRAAFCCSSSCFCSSSTGGLGLWASMWGWWGGRECGGWDGDRREAGF